MIPREFQELIEPLERFEAIRRRAVRLGSRLCDLSYANPYGGAQREAVTAIKDALGDERLLDLQYTPFGGQTLARRAVADALRESHGLDFAFGDVVLTPGAMAALHLALLTAGQPGDEVVIPVPCWLDYPLYARACRLKAITVPLARDTLDLDVDAIAGAVTEKTCAILLSHPANPTGRYYGQAQFDDLAHVLRDAEDRLGCKPTLIADETHRDFTLSDERHTAAALWDRTIIVYSFGKYHFTQGQRLGYAAVPPAHPAREDLAAEMVRWTRITGMATPTSLMQRALPRLLALHHDQTFIDTWRRRMVEELTSAGHSVVPPEATMFIYVKTPAGFDDFEFVVELAAQGVLVLPAPVFHHQGYFRVSLTGSERMLEQSLPVLDRYARA